MKIADYEKIFKDTSERILSHPHDEHSVIRQRWADMPEKEDPYEAVNYAQGHLVELAVFGVKISCLRLLCGPTSYS